MGRAPRPPDDAFKRFAYEQFARIARALCAPHRLVLVNVLSQGPHTVEHLAACAGISVANASRHLQVLKSARLVESERRGNHIVYVLANEDVRDFFHALKRLAFDRLPELREALDEVSRSPSRSEALDRDGLLARLGDGRTVVLDVRPEAEYRHAHLPGAVSIPLDELKERIGSLPRDASIVAYCRGRYCLLADRAVELLRGAGYQATRTDVDVTEWQRANLPLERGVASTPAAEDR